MRQVYIMVRVVRKTASVFRGVDALSQLGQRYGTYSSQSTLQPTLQSKRRIATEIARGAAGYVFSLCLGSVPEPSSTSQQPGSPGCPQQLLRVRILVQLLARTRPSFRPSGMGALMFENTELRLGIVPSSVFVAFAGTCN